MSNRLFNKIFNIEEEEPKEQEMIDIPSTEFSKQNLPRQLTEHKKGTTTLGFKF